MNIVDEGYSVFDDVITTFVKERKMRSHACEKLLRGFELWLKNNGKSLFDFQIIDVETYCEEKINNGEWSGSSAKTFVAYLKGFCKWLSGYALSNIENARLRRIRGMKIDFGENISITKSKPFFLQSLNINRYKKLLEYSHKNCEEDFVYFWLLGWHGLRVGEFVSIKPENIVFKESKFNGITIPKNALWVQTEKTHMMRLLFFDDFTAEIWKKVKNGEVELRNTQHIRNRMKRYDKKIGIHLHPHQLRMLFNTSMKSVIGVNDDLIYKKFNVAVDDNIIKVMMGHSIVLKNMTELYNKYSPELLKFLMTDIHYMKEIERNFKNK